MGKLKNRIKELPGMFSAAAWCMSLSWGASKAYTIIRLLCEAVAPFLAIAASFLGKYAIDLLTGARGGALPGLLPSEPDKALLVLLALLLAAALVSAGLQKASQYAQAMHGDMISGRISLMMMDKSLSVDLECFDNPEYYDKLQSANQDSMAMAHILWNVLSCVRSAVSFVSSFIILSGANMAYGLVLLAAAVPASAAAARYTKLLYMLSLDQINEHRNMYYCQSVASSRDYAQDMRLFGAGGRLKERYGRIWGNLFTKRRGMARRRSVLTGLLECLPEIAVALIGADIAFKALRGAATVGDYSLYAGLTLQLSSAISGLSISVMQIYDNKLKIENVRKLDKFESRVADNGTTRLDRVDAIEFDEVSFAYPDAKSPALDGASFTLCKNEKVALVGLNGSGKTTLIKLLLRMYDPDSGAIRINGTDIKEYSLSELRANFSVYFQEMHNYSFTLMENLAIADETLETDEEAANAALLAASCGDILQKSPKGLGTSLTKRFSHDGIELSGGQHQKLALARALFRRHTALILDEPSSNLDPKAEHEIFESLKCLSDGKMTIFTSHRLSNVSLADRILVLEHGRIVEDGTQEELLRDKHLYAELFRYQQEKYSQGTIGTDN